MSFVLENKQDAAIARIIAEYADGLRAIYLVGTAATNPTATSDLDLLLVLEDAFFGANFERLRGEVDAIAAELNAGEPRHELAFWISKEDHFATLLPDVSYLRANTPNENTRLDGWCGLAKHALMRYAATSGRRLHGDFEFARTPVGAPATEAPELFLIATRALAKGIAGLDASDAEQRALARNESAKAGLRAIAALLLARDGRLRLSYDRILADCSEYLPDEFSAFARVLHAAKTQGAEGVDKDRLIDLIRHCETGIAPTPYLAAGGLTVARAGESFGFSMEAINALGGKAKQRLDAYDRVPFQEQNHYLFLYFVRTASRMVELLDENEVAHGPALDFFLPEIATMAALTSLNPFGMKMLLGRSEREDFVIELGLPMAARLFRLLQRLDAFLDLDGGRIRGEPWLGFEERRKRVKFLLFQLGSIPQLDTPDGAGEFDHNGLVEHLEWQMRLAKDQFSLPAFHQFGEFGLLLYRSGDLDGARRVLGPLLANADRLDDLADVLGEAGREQAEALRPLLSNAAQYYALTYHREGDAGTARDAYLKALQLNPANKSALADLCTLLLATSPDDDAVTLLGDLVQRAGGGDDFREEVARQFQDRAITARQAGDFETALTWYGHALDLHPGWAMACFNRGLLHEARGDIHAAGADYRAAIERDPDYVRPRNRLADLLRESGDPDAARAVLEEVFDRGIETADSYNALGCCALERHDLDAAVAAFEAAVERDDGNLIALANLATALGLRGKDSGNAVEMLRAETLAAEAMRRDPTDAFARSLHARLKHEMAVLLGGS